MLNPAKITIMEKLKKYGRCIFALLTIFSTSCTTIINDGEKESQPEFKSYPDMVYNSGKQVLDVLDAVFYADKYICADEQERENVLRMYFRDSEIKYDDATGTLDMTYAPVNSHEYDFNIKSGKLSVQEQGAEWEVTMRRSNAPENETYTFALCCLGKDHKVTGTILTDGVSDKGSFYNVVDLQFSVGENKDIQYFDEEKIDQILYRPVMTYKINGTIATSVTGNNEVSNLTSTLTNLSGYDPKEYIDNEPIYTGYDSYFTSGRISTVITLTSGTEISMESSVHMRSSWTVSINGGEGQQYCPSQVWFGDRF